MARSEPPEEQKDSDRGSEYMKGGKGRRDDVRGSGVYPASAPDVPEDAEPRTPGEFVQHKGGKRDTDR